VSIDKIDQSLHKLDSIKRYDNVIIERDSALSAKSELEKEKRLLVANLSRQRNKVRGLKESLSKKEAELMDSRKREVGRESKIQELTSTVRDLRSRNKELECLKTTTDGKSLKEVEKAFLKSKGAEIKRSAESHFQEMKEDWEKNKKDRVVSATAIGYLNNILAFSSGEQPSIRRELTGSSLPGKVGKVIGREVSKRLNAEFAKRVESESEKRAREKLESMRKGEWEKWYSSKIEPKLSQFEISVRDNSLAILRGDFIVRCDRCNTGQTRTIAQAEIDDLLRMGKIWIECINPNCKGFWFKHRFPITMRDLIKAKLEI